MLIFTRTKTGAADVSERLQGRGYAAEAMHGDMNQAQRESVIRRLKAGQVEIVVATDVAARGLDVERICHVVNYDIPNDLEAYVHRIGRTGRAGRSGVAVLFVLPRERRMMTEIERYTGQRIMPMKMPTQADVAARRIAMFKDSMRSVERRSGSVPLPGRGARGGGARPRRDRGRRGAPGPGGQAAGGGVEPEPTAVPGAEDGMVRLFIGAGRMTGVRPGDSWAPSPTRRACPASRSARSTSTTASPSWRSRRNTATGFSSAW